MDSGGVHMQMSREIELDVTNVLWPIQLDFLIDSQTTDTWHEYWNGSMCTLWYNAGTSNECQGILNDLHHDCLFSWNMLMIKKQSKLCIIDPLWLEYSVEWSRGTAPTSTTTHIAKFMGPTWGPPESCHPQMDPMLAPWTMLSGHYCCCCCFMVLLPYIDFCQTKVSKKS